MMSDPRKFRSSPRRRLNTQISLWKNRIPETVIAKDISVTGVFIETTELIRPRAYHVLTLNLPTHQNFTALCKVVRTGGGRGLGVGLEFVDLKQRDRDQIAAYVDAALGHAAASAVAAVA